MRVNPGDLYLKSKLVGQLSKIEKGLQNKIIVNKELDSIIMLGNGDVDDFVVAIICYKLNRTKTVGMYKPKNKKNYDISWTPRLKTNRQQPYPQRCSTVSMIPEYSMLANKMALVMDQEDESLDVIFLRVEKNLRNLGISIIDIKKIGVKIRHYQCLYASKKLDFILIISGLSELQTRSHKIEDHLVKLAIKLDKIKSNNIEDSKNIWRSISDSDKSDVLKELLYSNDDMLYEIFSQHCEGLRTLKKLCECND